MYHFALNFIITDKGIYVNTTRIFTTIRFVYTTISFTDSLTIRFDS